MQLFIAIDGEKRGPHSIFAVIEMLRDGQVKPDSLGWHQGAETWVPLEEIPALQETISQLKQAESITEPDSLPTAEREASPPVPVPTLAPGSAEAAPKRKPVVTQEIRPFTRFWARIFDYMLVYTVVWWIAGVPVPEEASSSWEWMREPDQFFDQEELVRLTTVTFGAFAIWHAVEAILLHVIGTTPGKALFNIRVRRYDGGRARLTKTLGRSYYVWLAGFGLGIFPFNLIGMAFSFFRLLSTGTALWDKHLRLYVQHAPMGPARILLALAAFFLLMALQQIVFT